MLRHLPILIGLIAVGAFSHYAAEYYKPQIEADLTTRSQAAIDSLKQPKITVEAEGQTIVLSGEVTSDELRRKAEDEVHQVDGVAVVRNQLKVAAVMGAASCEGVVGGILEHSAVTFAGAGSALEPASLPVLENIAGILAECPAVDFEVFGYANAKLSREKYTTLTTARADAVIAQLVAKGVAATRLGRQVPDPKEATDRIAIRARK